MSSRAQELRARLKQGLPFVVDGAMGTELYRRGQFLNKPFEGANLTSADLVSRIHQEYMQCGVDALETNTFASSRWRLRQVGLEADFEAINQAGVRLAREAAAGRAFVLGACGPAGMKWLELDEVQRQEAIDFAEEHALCLAGLGVDGLFLETYGVLDELSALLARLRPQTDLPLLASVAFLGEGVTQDGATPERVIEVLREAGADVVGANCADGPMELYALASRMVGHGVPVAVLPNAGYPKRVEGRTIYMATPEYFGVFARRFLKAGVQVLGGCCGTTPAHIQPVANAARMFRAAGEAGEGRVEVRETRGESAGVERRPAVPVAQRSRLGERLADPDAFVVSVEVNPPVGLDPAAAIRGARMLQAAGVDVVNIADGPRASVRMANWSLALELQRALQMEAIVHVCARDRNLIGLQSDLLAFAQLGLNNLVIITGDPPKLGDYPHATAVFDLDSVRLLRLAEDMNEGIAPNGQSLGGSTRFLKACGVEPAALDYERELRRLEAKVAAGADFIMTQPVYDPAVLDRLLTDIRDFTLPVLVGLMPLASARNAEFLHNEVPGMQIPAEIRHRMASVPSGAAARAEGVRIAQEALLGVRDRVRGAYIMPPFGRYEAAIEVLEAVGFQRPAAYRETWRT
mgnify:CR=1 FL=1